MLELTKEDLITPGNYEGYETLLDWIVCSYHCCSINFNLLISNSIPEFMENSENYIEVNQPDYIDPFKIFDLLLIALETSELNKLILKSYMLFRIQEIEEFPDSTGFKLEEFYEVIANPKNYKDVYKEDACRFIRIMIDELRESNSVHQKIQEEEIKFATQKIDAVFEKLRKEGKF